MWGKERSLSIWEGLRALCLSLNLTGQIWHDLEDMHRLIEAGDFDNAQHPYNRVQGKLINLKYERSTDGTVQSNVETRGRTKRKGSDAFPLFLSLRGASESPPFRGAYNSNPFRRYNERMSMQVDAVYEHGMLKPLGPLDLVENERVQLLITPVARASGACRPDVEFTEGLRSTLQEAGPAPGLDEVRRRLSKIPGTLTSDFIAEREDR